MASKVKHLHQRCDGQGCFLLCSYIRLYSIKPLVVKCVTNSLLNCKIVIDQDFMVRLC